MMMFFVPSDNLDKININDKTVKKCLSRKGT